MALVPLKKTPVAPVKLVPVIVTLVPAGPLVGVKLIILTCVGVKLAVLVALPLGVSTEIGPALCPPGEVAVIVVAFTTV